MLDFIDEAQLDRVGCFTYSPVKGASANDLPNPVPEELKQERYARFMAKQQAVSRARLASKVGRTLQVLVDEIREDGVAVARSQADAPEIDGSVFIESAPGLKPGDLAEVRIESADDYDLFARKVA